MTTLPRIVFLDQNKWIELLKAETSPYAHPEQYAVLRALEDKLKSKQIVLPLSGTNIYETYKIGDAQKREALGFLQARFSGGLVLRGRHNRLEAEFAQFLAGVYRLPRPLRAPWWFLSDVFVEAFADQDDERLLENIPASFVKLTRETGGMTLHLHFKTATEEERLAAVQRWTAGSLALCARIEDRRLRHKNEPLAMRRKIYSVLMMTDAMEHLIRLAARNGVDWSTAEKIGSSVARRLVEEVPLYFTERELVLRMEAQNRPINENDLRDVQAYCAALVYADLVVGENQLINLARQGGLGDKYNTRLETSLLTLLD